MSGKRGGSWSVHGFDSASSACRGHCAAKSLRQDPLLSEYLYPSRSVYEFWQTVKARRLNAGAKQSTQGARNNPLNNLGFVSAHFKQFMSSGNVWYLLVELVKGSQDRHLPEPGCKTRWLYRQPFPSCCDPFHGWSRFFQSKWPCGHQVSAGLCRPCELSPGKSTVERC